MSAQQHRSSIQKINLYLSALVIALLAGLSSFVMGQATTENTKNTPDQTLRSNARVNPATLAMEFSIPIVDFPGRGGMSMPLVFNYSSKVWRFELSGYGQAQTVKYTTNIPRYAEGSAAGWTSSFGNARIESYQEMYDCHGNPLGEAQGQSVPPPTSVESPQGYCGQGVYYINRLRIKLPDGSTQTLLKDDSVHDSVTDPISWAGTYLATDGSRSRLELTSSSGGILYLPDGSKYYFNSAHEGYKYEDRNGNVVNFNTSTRTWTDTLGRSLTSPLPLNLVEQWQTAGTQELPVPGLTGEEDREYNLVWKNLSDTGVLYPSETLLPAGNQTCPNISATYTALFQGSLETRICTGSAFNPVVLHEIVLPNGSKYKFQYNKFGEMTKIEYPTGGSERFTYGEVEGLSFKRDMVHDQANRGVTDRWVKESANATEQHWTYETFKETVNTNVSRLRIKTTAPDNQTITEQYMESNWSNDYPSSKTKWGFENPVAGRPYEDRVYSGTTLKSRKLTEYDYNGKGSTNTTPAGDPKVKREISVTYEPNDTNALVTMTTYAYDTTGSTDPKMFASSNLKTTEQYDYIVVAATTATSESVTDLAARFNNITPAVRAETVYSYSTNYVNSTRSILGMVSEKKVVNPSTNAVVSRTEMSYDEYSLDTSVSLPSYATSTWNTSTSTYRGNVTTVRSFTDVANSQSVETHSYYDVYGNAKKTVDANQNESLMFYSTDYACAYLTGTSSPVPDLYGTYGSSSALTTSMTYDFNTGLPLTTVDVNAQTTQMSYADPVTGFTDPLLRIRKVTAPNGHQTITEYGAPDSSGILPLNQRYVKVKTQIDGTNWKQGYTWFDGHGRTVKTQSVDSSGDVFTETEYDSMGRAWRSTNPYRTGETVQWTSTTFDTFGRVWKVTTPDTAFVETTYGLATSGSQIGTSVTVTDQALKSRRNITNALGQLKRVDEPDTGNSNQLGTVSSPYQPTTYNYDLLNNLVQVQQNGTSTQQCGGSISSCTQTRSFVYDSLSRLKSSTNPEMGTTSTNGTIYYQYDNNSNLTQKTDARGVVTAYAYDALNRLKTRSYSNEPTGQTPTPTVSYYYDGKYYNASNQSQQATGSVKGKLTSVSSDISRTNYTAFDTMGNITASQQITEGTIYASSYVYNLSGALIEQTYPSGRVVKNVLDSDGDLAKVQSKKTQNASFWNYAQNFTYTAGGAMSSMQLGNTRWESTTFNSRLQPTQIALGTSQNATNLLKLDYSYNTPNTADNSWVILSQTITVPAETRNNTTYNSFTVTQTYTYDSLNRIKDAKEMAGTTENWKQTFKYDRYGNRNFDEPNTTATATFLKNCNNFTTVCTADVPIVNPTVNTTTNKNQLNGYTYDNVGNTTKDAQNRKFTYDGENKQIKVETLDSYGNVTSTLGEYFYDGDEKRVKKVAGNELTIFVYDAAGKLVAEYSNQISTNPQVSYLTTDNLGSPRINTDKNGNVVSRHDYQPFGEEIQRASYGVDAVRKKFTGYEKDTETDLDFAQARYYSKSLGRFNSTDPLFYTASRPADPQQFNLYAYVRDNPLALVDPNGKDAKGSSMKDGQIVAITEGDREKLETDLNKVAPGTKVLQDGTVKKPSFLKRVANRLSGKGAGTDLVGRIVDAKNMTDIVVNGELTGTTAGNSEAFNNGQITKGNVFEQMAKKGQSTDSLVFWNPNQTAEAGEFTTTAGFQTKPNSAASLAHELIHGEGIVSGTTLFGFANREFTHWGRNFRENGDPGEFNTTFGGFRDKPRKDGKSDINENQIRKELGANPRVAYAPYENWKPR